MANGIQDSIPPRDAALPWAFVPAYLVHGAEEWFGGFPHWVGQITGRPLPEATFLLINAIGLVLLVIGVRLTTRANERGWIGVMIATAVLFNTVVHAAGAVLTGAYAPGVISAVVLFLPIGSLTMIRARKRLPRSLITRGIVAGVLLHAVVLIVAWASRM